LQALALERETVEDIVDYVMPDEEGMGKVDKLFMHFINI
jgi:hypothetical protein